MQAMSDLDWGAFTEQGPWTLDPNNIPWMAQAPELRRAARAEVPVLTSPKRFPPGTRVLTVAGQVITAVSPWLVRKRRGRFTDTAASRADISLRLRKAAEVLGPTYIKLGQIISSGEGLFLAVAA